MNRNMSLDSVSFEEAQLSKIRAKFPAEQIIEWPTGRFRVMEPSKHFNAEYVEQRNKLIPGSVAYARSVVPIMKTDSQKADWSKAFHTKMDSLAKTYIFNVGV